MLQNSLALREKETKLPVIGEEKDFVIARKAKPINKLPEIDLRNVLKYAMIKVGVRGKNFPVGVEKSLLLNHIFENYGNHTAEEIKLAFDLAIAGKLGLDTNDIKCYENFSCLYFSNIMNAYRIWAEQVYRQNIKPVLQIEQKPDLEQIEKEYQEFLQTDLGKKLNPKI